MQSTKQHFGTFWDAPRDEKRREFTASVTHSSDPHTHTKLPTKPLKKFLDNQICQFALHPEIWNKQPNVAPTSLPLPPAALAWPDADHLLPLHCKPIRSTSPAYPLFPSSPYHTGWDVGGFGDTHEYTHIDCMHSVTHSHTHVIKRSFRVQRVMMSTSKGLEYCGKR